MQRRTSRAGESGATRDDLELVADSPGASRDTEASQRQNDRGPTSATNQALISDVTDQDANDIKYLTGWRFYFLTTA